MWLVRTEKTQAPHLPPWTCRQESEGCGAQALRAVATVHCAHPMCRAKQVDDGAAHGAALAEFAPFYLGREIAAGLERCYVHDAAGAEAADS